MNQTTLHNYFKGTASEREEKLILNWIEVSEENKKMFQKERMLYDIALFHSKTEKEKPQTTTSRFLSITKWTARIAAAVIVILGCRVLIKEYRYNQNIPMQTITVPTGQRAELALADGTRVWLNAGTSLTYPTNFGKKERNVELDGEAYFEVARNTQIPFFVHTEANKVRVVGTSFNITAYKGSGEFETILIEGIVDIYPAGCDKVITRLTENEVFSCKQDISRKGKVKSDEQIKWKEGLYCFDDCPIKQIFSKLEKYYNVKFIVEDTNMLDYRITGKFRDQDGVEHILKAIQKDYKFDYEIDTNNNMIRIYQETELKKNN